VGAWETLVFAMEDGGGATSQIEKKSQLKKIGDFLYFQNQKIWLHVQGDGTSPRRPYLKPPNKLPRNCLKYAPSK
jgi:hypothetical protein